MTEELNIDFGEIYDFDMKDGDETVGNIAVSVHKQKEEFRGENQVYPDSWFIDDKHLKPILEIDGFGTCGFSEVDDSGNPIVYQGKGYGRAGLQRAYEISLEKGCEGRMEVYATWGAGSFYEHCGFACMDNKNRGHPGIKYFEPTKENIAKLYKGGRNETLSLQPANVMDCSGVNLDDLLAEIEDQSPTSDEPQVSDNKINIDFMNCIKQKHGQFGSR